MIDVTYAVPMQAHEAIMVTEPPEAGATHVKSTEDDRAMTA